MKLSLQVTSNKLPAMLQRIPERTHEVVGASLLRVQAGCREKSRVDTGEMRDAWAVAFTGPTDGEVFNDTEQVIPNEYGTVHMSAQPMLAPSIDEERPRYIAELAKVVSEVG